MRFCRRAAVSFIVFQAILFFNACSPHYLNRQGWMFYSGDRKDIVMTAKKYVGVRYKNGGATPSGFDCSGFTMYVYEKNGLSIPRTAIQQFDSGRRIGFPSLKPGDLVFFIIKGAEVSHVGIYVGRHRFIHAPRQGKKVSYASLDNPYWKKKCVGAVSYISRGKGGRGSG